MTLIGTVTDLAVLSTANKLNILLGNGDGTFNSALEKTVPTAVFSVLPADFNGDNKLDLVMLGFPSSVLSLTGNGDGTFADAVSYAAGSEAGKATVVDLNSDGRLDIAVANRNAFTILLGKIDGTFQSGITYPLVAMTADIISGDFDGDNRVDLAVANYYGGVSFLAGNGDGTFKPAVLYSAGSYSGSLVAGDFNNDGRSDLAITSSGNAKVSILLNAAQTRAPALPVLLVEENVDRAVALDSATQTRDPFSLDNPFNFSSDRLPRVSLFAWGLDLLPGEVTSAVTAVAEDAQGHVYSLPVEYVGPTPGLGGLTQVVVKIPQDVGAPADLWVKVSLRGATTNRALIKIKAP